MNLTTYLSDSIEHLFRSALRASLGNPRESRFLLGAVSAQKKAAARRLLAEREGHPVPAFLIASIATRCNLHCAGCYARANRACADTAASQELGSSRWGELFGEAAELGVSFILLAGGEPLERPDVLEEAAGIRGVVFPVFTNGTLFGDKALAQFERCRNLIPVVSLEGNPGQTDQRRGAGTYDLVEKAMDGMSQRGIFFGASVTVTTENLETVSDEAFMAGLHEKGCRFVIFVEYVPVDGNTALAPGEPERALLAGRQDRLRELYPDMIFLSFPGDEKQLGGCLAAGRGFFHINAFGGAEPCPFSPFSDISLKTGSIREALDSPLFRKIRESGLESGEHAGGCVLFENSGTVESLLAAR